MNEIDKCVLSEFFKKNADFIVKYKDESSDSDSEEEQTVIRIP
jgi:hypothetical protein